jgi:hypothetical protein
MHSYIADMIGQKGIKTGSKGSPVRDEAVENCLVKLPGKSIESNASVHMPRIGCGPAGGKRENMEPLINKNLTDREMDVFVYDM